MIRQLLLALCLMFNVVTVQVQAYDECEPLVFRPNAAPFDYNDTSDLARERLRLAEGSHFTQSVRAGVAGNAGSLVGDLDFVLRVFPNHPYALAVMADVQQRPGFSRQHPLRRDKYYPTIGCYFKRALQMAPNDPNVFLVLAINQHKQKNFDKAKTNYLKALAIKSDAVEAHYNLGLLLVTMGELKQALEHAHAAYALGYPLPGLREQLQRKGAWREPDSTSASNTSPDAGR
jgi:tetratricopeptide (TPR) repeat protein